MTLTLLGTAMPAPSMPRQTSGIDVAGDALVFDHGLGDGHRGPAVSWLVFVVPRA